MAYTVTLSDRAFGEPFIEDTLNSAGEALSLASHYIANFCVNDPTTEEWTIVSLEGCGPELLLEVHWTWLDQDTSISGDYMMQVVAEKD